jgi:hypothetical protein
MHSAGRRNAVRAIRAVSSGTGGNGLGCSDTGHLATGRTPPRREPRATEFANSIRFFSCVAPILAGDRPHAAGYLAAVPGRGRVTPSGTGESPRGGEGADADEPHRLAFKKHGGSEAALRPRFR